jgi:D-arabinose 1-dehydrogenase-like Zn-dependent alcohol dehydrogenase
MCTSVLIEESVGVVRAPDGSVGPMTRILVTGAGGILGTTVLRVAQEKSIDVRAWTHRDAGVGGDMVVGEITNFALADRATRGIDYVLRLAARKRDESDSVGMNVDGSRILAEAARRNGVKHFVYVSTQSVKWKMIQRIHCQQTNKVNCMARSASSLPMLRSSTRCPRSHIR